VIVTLVLRPSQLVAMLTAVSVNVDDDVPGLGENEPERPLANPDADSVTGLEKPLLGEIVTV
jgi:hypothetical protein